MNRLMAVLAVSCLLGVATSLTETPKTGFIAWRELQVNVLGPKREFKIKLLLTDPCGVIQSQFEGFWAPDSNDYNPVYYAYHGCNANFDKWVKNPMDDLVTRFNARTRKPRAIPLLGLLGGIWLSNVIDTYFNDNAEVAEHESAQNEALRQLNLAQNYSTEAVIALAQQNNFLIEKVNKLYTLTDRYARHLLRLQFALDLFSTSANNKHNAIDKIRFGLINKHQFDLHALNELLETKVFENVDSESLEFVSVDKAGDRGYIFRFYGHIIDEDMRVFQVSALDHWTNLTADEATLMSYDGPPMVMVNTSINCVGSLWDLKGNSLSQGCATKNGRSKDLDSWIPKRHGNPFDKPTSTVFIEDLPSINVYCLGRSITIADEPSFDCPPYAIRIPSHLPWQTDDESYPGLPRTVLNFDTKVTLPSFIVPNQIQDPNSTKFIETDALKKIRNLTDTLTATRQGLYALNTPIGGVSYAIWNKILMLTILCMIVICIWVTRLLDVITIRLSRQFIPNWERSMELIQHSNPLSKNWRRTVAS